MDERKVGEFRLKIGGLRYIKERRKRKGEMIRIEKDCLITERYDM